MGLLQRALLSFALLGSLAAQERLSAAVINFTSPTLDKAIYENRPAEGGYGGTYGTASIFSSPDTDGARRLAYMLLGFSTAGSIQTGRGASNYLVTSVRLTLYAAVDMQFRYDPTYDSYRSHLPSTDPNSIVDDPGRSIEVYGVGLRNGYTSLGTTGGTSVYKENSPIVTSGAMNAYPLSYDANGTPFDVTNNVAQGRESNPFGIGQSSLTAGAFVPQGTEFRFDLDLSNPNVLAYIQAALNGGMLGLNVSGLVSAESQTATDYASFFTKDNELGAEFVPRLEVTYTIVPEPQSAALAFAACGLLAARRGSRKRGNRS